METIFCKIHNNPIIIFESKEEMFFTGKINATVVFYDSKKIPYLKRFTLGKCDENCPEVKKILFGEIKDNIIEISEKESLSG